MENAAFPRRWFAWLALATFGTLLVIPTTRSLFYTQARMETLTYSIEMDRAAEIIFGSSICSPFSLEMGKTGQPERCACNGSCLA